MPRLDLKVVGNRLYSDVVDSSPRYAREAIMPSSSTVENFLRFQVQDKHNASVYFVCRESAEANSTAKLAIISQSSAIRTFKSAENRANSIELKITNAY